MLQLHGLEPGEVFGREGVGPGPAGEWMRVVGRSVGRLGSESGFEG